MAFVFMRNSGALVPNSYPRVVISPRDIRWNDFGYNFHAAAEIKMSEEGEALELRALVIPFDSFDGEQLKLHSNFDDWLRSELQRIGKSSLNVSEDLVQSEFHPPFALIFQGESSYRNLAKHVASQEERIDMLTRLNDLVMMRQAQINTDCVDALLTSQPFTLGVLRTGSAYRALHRGGRFIFGNYDPPLEDARVAMLFSCQLKGFNGAPHRLSVEFFDNDVVDDRIHCLVGKNGCGKTRVLHELVLQLGKRATEDEGVTPFLDNESSSARLEPSFAGVDYGRVICFSSDAQSRFPKGVRNNSRFEYVYVNLNVSQLAFGVRREDSLDPKDGDFTFSQGINAASGETTTRLLTDILRNTDSVGSTGKTRWAMFRSALKSYVDMSKLELPLLFDEGPEVEKDRRWVGAQELYSLSEKASLVKYSLIDHDHEARFAEDGVEIPLSSGERMFFRFALNLLSYVDVGTLLIIDEPETHLHPNLVCDFMNLLYEVLAATSSIALIATHSAYVIREVPTHCAHIYSVDDERCPAEGFAYLRTLGANIESISQAIFSDSNARKFHSKIVKSMAAEGLTLEDLIEKYGDMISPDLLSQVARLMVKRSTDEGSAG